jgi:hypothetical protein
MHSWVIAKPSSALSRHRMNTLIQEGIFTSYERPESGEGQEAREYPVRDNVALKNTEAKRASMSLSEHHCRDLIFYHIGGHKIGHHQA